MPPPSFIRIVPAAVLLFAAGCASKIPLEQTPVSQAALDAFLANGRDARYYGIVTYQDPGGSRYESANRPHTGQSAQRDIVSPPGWPLPIVKARSALSKDEFPILMDSSARQSWATMQSGESLEYRPFAPPTGEYADHVFSEIPGYAGAGNKLIFDTLHVEYPVFCVPPAGGGLGPLVRLPGRPDEPPPKRAGSAMKLAEKMPAVAGAALMRSFSFVRFDFPGRKVQLCASATYRPPSSNAVLACLLLGDWRGRPTVQATLRGKPIALLIDTAGDFELSLPDAADAEGPLLLGRLQIDDVRIDTHAGLGLPDKFPARLGVRLLARYAVTLDFKQQRVWFEGAPPASDTPDAGSGETETPIQYRGIAP